MNQDVEVNPPALYYVSYTVLDGRAGANPFGHSCLIFSKTDSLGRLEVEKIYGYYSQTSTTTNPFVKWLKSILGIKYDLQGTHAVLHEEKMREFIGDGLKGLSFAITAEQYQAFLATMADRYQIQNEQIEALDMQLAEQNLLPNGSARYRLQGQKQDIPPARILPPFHIQSTCNLNTSGSVTCKQLALNLLQDQGIINQHQRTQLECQPGFRQAFPRYADLELAPIRLQATGTFIKEESRQGKIYYNPSQDNGNQLFWVLPPNLGSESEELKNLRTLDAKFKPIMQSYRDLLKQLYPLNSSAAADAINRLHASIEPLTYQGAALDPKLEKLKIALAYAQAVINPNYFHSSRVQRVMADRDLMVLGLVGLGLTGVSIGLLFAGLFYSGLGLAITAAWMIDALALVKASLNFQKCEEQWQVAKAHHQTFLADEQAQFLNSLPSGT